MRIAYFLHQFLPNHIGGTEIYTHGLATRARNHPDVEEVVIVCYEESPKAENFETWEDEHNGLRVIHVPYNLSIASNRVLYEYANRVVAEQVCAALRSFKPTHVHATHLIKISIISALEAVRVFGVKLWLSATDYWFICPRHTLLRPDGDLCQGPVPPTICANCLAVAHAAFASVELTPWSSLGSSLTLQLGESKGTLDEQTAKELVALQDRLPSFLDLVNASDGVIVLTSFLRDKLLEFGFDPKKLHYHPHGIEDLRPATKVPAKKLRFTFIGSMVEHKGAHIAIEAIRQLSPEEFPDISLSIYGPITPGQTHSDKVLALAEGDERVYFEGTFPPEEIATVLGEADALLMPAQWFENGPLIIKQAHAAGLPVIASDLGSLSEMIRPGVDGLLVNHDSVPAWTAALSTAVTAWRARSSPWSGGISPDNPPSIPTADAHFAAVMRLITNDISRPN